MAAYFFSLLIVTAQTLVLTEADVNLQSTNASMEELLNIFHMRTVGESKLDIIDTSGKEDKNKDVDCNNNSDQNCCNVTYETFLRTWYQGKLKLTSLLSYLRTWKCPQFSYECQRRTFAFTQYTSLVYDRFCDFDNYKSSCQTTRDTTSSIENHVPDICNQVRMFDTSAEYLEIIVPYTPFCGVVWCGFSLQDVNSKKLSCWSCMTSRCKVNAILVMTVCGILGILTIILNATVVWFLKGLPNSRHSQVLYKLSLAIADLFVGISVFGTFVTTLYFRLVSQREIIHNKVNASSHSVSFGDDLKVSYLSAVGVFTNVSLLVSICTLMLTSYDRLNAVWKPMTYSRAQAYKNAKWMLFLTWAVTFGLATLPLYVPTLSPFSLISGLIVAAKKPGAIIIYFIAFSFPLIAVWTIIIAIYCIAKKRAKVRRRLTSNRMTAGRQNQLRLVKTLLMMLTAFTISLIPMIIAVFLQTDERIHDTYPEKYDPDVASAASSYQLLAIIFLTCNSLWNFFIYSARNTHFRNQALKKYKAILSAIFCYTCLSFQQSFPVTGSRKRLSSLFSLTNESPKSPNSPGVVSASKELRNQSSNFTTIGVSKTPPPKECKSTLLKTNHFPSIISLSNLKYLNSDDTPATKSRRSKPSSAFVFTIEESLSHQKRILCPKDYPLVSTKL